MWPFAMPLCSSTTWTPCPTRTRAQSERPATAWAVDCRSSRPESSADASAAAASFHGGNLAKKDDPDSPHHKAGAIEATVYVAGAVEDQSFPDEQKDRLETALTEAGVAHTIETYPAHHGFAVPDNATYDEAASERHWRAMENLFASVLRS